jgi:hypothetical protein
VADSDALDLIYPYNTPETPPLTDLGAHTTAMASQSNDPTTPQMRSQVGRKRNVTELGNMEIDGKILFTCRLVSIMGDEVKFITISDLDRCLSLCNEI